MKNLNQEGLNELSQEEAKKIEGGNWLIDLIDEGINWISKQYCPVA